MANPFLFPVFSLARHHLSDSSITVFLPFVQFLGLSLLIPLMPISFSSFFLLRFHSYLYTFLFPKVIYPLAGIAMTGEREREQGRMGKMQYETEDSISCFPRSLTAQEKFKRTAPLISRCDAFVRRLAPRPQTDKIGSWGSSSHILSTHQPKRELFEKFLLPFV